MKTDEKMKEDLKREFETCGCGKLWKEYYDLDVMSYSEILKESDLRAERYRCSGDLTDAEISFIAMVESWS